MKERIPTLKELYDANVDVRDSYIPEHWKQSFDRFICGQGCIMEDKLDGSGEKEFVYFASDFRRWYYQNQVSIDREHNIKKIID
jgi:hypothetical protein